MKSNVGLFRRNEYEQERLLRATMPTAGVVEYDDLVQRLAPSGRVWRDGKATMIPVNRRTS